MTIDDPTVTSPQIKKEEYRDYKIEGADSFLQLHTITEYNINGRMVQYTEYAADSIGATALNVLKIIKYDRGGNRIGVMRYNSKHALVWSEEYILDQHGRKSKVIQTAYEETAARSKVTHYQYDNKGNLTGVYTYDADNELIAEYKRTYNSSGELASTNAWSFVKNGSEAKPLKRTVHTTHNYDMTGNLNSSETEVSEGKNKWKDIRIFENNFVTEWLSYKNGELLNHYKKNSSRPADFDEGDLPPPIPYQELPMEYDDQKRNPLDNITHSSLRTITVKTNTLGNPIKEVIREQQQVVLVTYFYYNEDDILIRQKRIHKLEDKIDEIQFEYDEFDNPIKEITFRDGQKTSERVFSYEYYR